MRLHPKIKNLTSKKLIGLKLEMSLVDNKTAQLWQNFMPRRKEIGNKLSDDLFSLQVYPLDYFILFKPNTTFIKWALVEVADFATIPNRMEAFTLKGGLYAVFDYKGSSAESASFFQKIFTEWFPFSGYQLDNRPHFEVLGGNYKNNDSNSEEEIWIPIKK